MTHLLLLLGTYGLFLGLPILYLGIVLWVYRPGAARRYRADGRIPFADASSGKLPRIVPSHRHGPTPFPK